MLIISYKSSAVAEMGMHLATVDMSLKLGGCCVPFRGELSSHLTQCVLDRCLPPYQVASWSIQPFGHNRHGPKIAVCAGLFFWGGELGSHLTLCGLGRGLPPYQVASWSIQPFGYTPSYRQTDRTDRQRSDSIGRTVLQTVAQKKLLFYSFEVITQTNMITLQSMSRAYTKCRTSDKATVAHSLKVSSCELYN